jgi:peptidoglycan/xylan/chitin deacetylase (PgdA/CDA1 family)
MGIPASLFVSPKIINEGSNFWFQELDYIGTHVARADVIAAMCDLSGWVIGHASRYSPMSLFKCLKLSDIKRSLEGLKKRFELDINQKFNITADELDELRSSDLITIGAHTMNHPILSNESSDDVEWEIRTSINVLGEMLDGEVKYFAFPNGISGLDQGLRERSILEDTVVKLALTTDIAFYDRRTDPLSIPRRCFVGSEGESGARIALKLLLVPVWDRLRPRSEVIERKKIHDGTSATPSPPATLT